MTLRRLYNFTVEKQYLETLFNFSRAYASRTYVSYLSFTLL
jgi:hypothetical protein